MAHLKKSASGHLLKNASGHLVKTCADTPQDCPSDCSGCDDPLTLTVSGFTGSCAHMNGTYTLARSGCSWVGPNESHLAQATVTCGSQIWGIAIIGSPFYQYSADALGDNGAPNLTGCPSAGPYVLVGNDDCAGQSGTGTIS